MSCEIMSTGGIFRLTDCLILNPLTTTRGPLLHLSILCIIHIVLHFLLIDIKNLINHRFVLEGCNSLLWWFDAAVFIVCSAVIAFYHGFTSTFSSLGYNLIWIIDITSFWLDFNWITIWNFLLQRCEYSLLINSWRLIRLLNIKTWFHGRSLFMIDRSSLAVIFYFGVVEIYWPQLELTISNLVCIHFLKGLVILLVYFKI